MKEQRLIDANALMEELEAYANTLKDFKVCEGVWESIKLTKDTPTADPVKHGRWVEDEYWDYECSVCGMGTDRRFRYCPHCGAKMEIDDETD